MKTRIIGIVLTAVLALGGAVLLTGYVRSADARALAGAQPVHAYIAAQTIPKGTAADAIQGYLQVKDVPAAAAVAGRVTNLAQLDGLTTNSAIEAGEQLLRARFSSPASVAAQAGTPLPAGMQAVTVKLPLEQAVGGTLKAGDLAGVVITDGGGVNDALAKQSLHKVLVLGVKDGATVAKPDTTGTQAPDVQLVTLALSGQDATELVWGQKWGVVWLSLETAGSKDGTSTVKRGACTSTCTAVHP